MDLQLPKISIITPSFNQSQYLEKTIQSVVDQNYPNLEYIIMDGGSTDGSVDIIKKYTNIITHWESNPDKGQADAIFRGFEQTTGDIIAWINSDDYYLDGAFASVGEFFAQHPEIQWIIGNGIFVDKNNKKLLDYYCPPVDHDRLLHFGMTIFQPTMFIKREFFFKCGGFDRGLQCSFDYDLVLRLSTYGPPGIINSMLAAFRFHKTSKTETMSEVNISENQIIRKKYGISHSKYINFDYRKVIYGLELFMHRLKTSGVIPYLSFKIYHRLP
jgi:glycosyltransferase involved in cell wall biosynthesis